MVAAARIQSPLIPGLLDGVPGLLYDSDTNHKKDNDGLQYVKLYQHQGMKYVFLWIWTVFR